MAIYLLAFTGPVLLAVGFVLMAVSAPALLRDIESSRAAGR